MNDFVSTGLIALGSNLPQPEGAPTANLARALREMTAQGLVIRLISRFFETPCFPEGTGPDYVNAAVSVATRLSPAEVLEVLHGIEADMGRTRETRWGMRSLDLDLIACDDMVLPDAPTVQNWVDLPSHEQRVRAPDELVLPHPRLADRAFVLVPLHDIAPHWRHPMTGLDVGQMLAALPASDIDAVRPI